MKFIRLICVLAVTACDQGASESISHPLATGTIVEELSQSVDTSTGPGGLIIGMIYGELPDAIELPQLGIQVPKSTSTSRLCLYASTQDGIYSATGSLTAEENADGYTKIEAPGFPQFTSELKAYNGLQFASIAILSDDCLATKKKDILPTSFKTDSSNLLTIYLNSHNSLKVDAALEKNREVVQAFECRQANGRAVAFDTICQVQAPSSSEKLDVVVSRWPRSGPFRKDRIHINLRGI